MTPNAPPQAWALSAALAGLSACMVVEKVGETGAPEATDLPGHAPPDGHSEPDSPRPELTEPAAPMVEVVYSAEGLELWLDGGPEPAFLAILETSGCLAGACWTGEACGEPFVAPNGDRWGPYCHAFASGGLALAWGGDPRALSPGETAFRSEHRSNMTFALRSGPSGESGLPCFSWGDDPGAFPDCTPL